ncbi:creatininase family protein [Rhodopirellula sp. MGV]|uniref:creatininase family protein n=1 Tax=Rhodopirellula sp. MGV TaxID=2023130 RepID=UPI000B96E1CC|nr:creatininase family protein [Rhodopirellula sp. MGV]OYP37388.1 creatininase [Rhodopirellula sp. MGV]PNY38073.1 creatininase [Rhodopirellula baltica]
MRPWILSEINYGFVKDCPYEVAVLPTGATEPHNLHLPYGTDTFQATEIASRACEAAWDLGARVVMLPPIPYGTETNQARFPLSMNLHPSTLQTILRDLLGSLSNSGIKKLLILNSHGGNEFKPMLRELVNQTPCKMFLCDWFRGISADVQADIFDEPGDHAGEMETALGLAFFREFVATDRDGAIIADDGAVKSTRFDAVNQGWISITRPWHLLTSNTGSGNPHPARAEKGHKLMEVLVDRISQFLVELAASDVDEQFPF